MRRTAEFDAFGPWVDEVRTAEEVPRLYRGHGVDPATTDLVLKVPRRISRRDATPDMHLYDHLVVVDARGLTLLTRRGTEYTVRHVLHDEVAAVTASVDLLDGRVSVADTGMADPDEPLAFRYNSVSQELVVRLVRALRARALGRPLAPADTPPGGDPAVPGTGAADVVGAGTTPAWGSPLALHPTALGPDDVALVTTVQDVLGPEPHVVPVAAHRRTRVHRRDGRLAATLDRVLPATLQAAVVAAGPGELHVVHRRRWFTTGRRPMTSVAHTVLLTDRVTGFALRRSERYRAVRLARITSGRAVTTLPFLADSDTASAVQGVLEAARRAS